MKQKRRGLRGDKNPMWNGGIRHGGDGRIFILKPEHPRSDKNGYVLRSILFSEKALGKPIPPKARVHHFDGDTSNDHENLVICESQTYHSFLHQRKRAFDSCGIASWRKCRYCGEYDDPRNLYISPPPRTQSCHRKCKNRYERDRYRKKKEL